MARETLADLKTQLAERDARIQLLHKALVRAGVTIPQGIVDQASMEALVTECTTNKQLTKLKERITELEAEVSTLRGTTPPTETKAEKPKTVLEELNAERIRKGEPALVESPQPAPPSATKVTWKQRMGIAPRSN